MYRILLIKLADKVSAREQCSYGELNDIGDATWKCHVIILILIEHMEKKNSTKHYVNVSYSCPKNCAVFNSLKYWKKFCWKFHNKTASVPLHKSINTHQFLHYIHAEQRMTFEKSSDINYILYIYYIWGLYVMDVNCKSCFC